MTADDIRQGDSHSGPVGPKEIAPSLARDIAGLDPGSAAALRRGPLAGAGAAAFWQLLAKHDIPQRDTEAWASVVQSIAILAGVRRGAVSETGPPVHDPTKTMGATLCDAGVSEARLARMLAARGALRDDLVVRMSRRLARNPDYRTFDVRTLALFIVDASERTDRQVAREYYRAQAAAAAKKDSQNQEDGSNG